MSNFNFLAAEFPSVHEAAVEAERQAGPKVVRLVSTICEINDSAVA